MRTALIRLWLNKPWPMCCSQYGAPESSTTPTALARQSAGGADATQDRETRADMPDCLSPDQRSAINGMCDGGLAYAEAASWLGVSIARLRAAGMR